MKIDASCVCIDNDFLSHVAESKLTVEVVKSTLSTSFSILSRTAIIHPLVYSHEVMIDNPIIKSIFQDGIIVRPTMPDIIGEAEEKKEYYCYLVNELYASLHATPIPVSDILTDWKRGSSLGEVHSLTLCVLTNCAMFLSDDAGSKQLKGIIEQKSLGRVEVYNRKEFFSIPAITNVVKRDTRHKVEHKKCN